MTEKELKEATLIAMHGFLCSPNRDHSDHKVFGEDAAMTAYWALKEAERMAEQEELE